MGRAEEARGPTRLWPEVRQVRAEAWAKGAHLGDLTDDAIAVVFERTEGDIDLAATALSMKPRPRWVAEIVGEE